MLNEPNAHHCLSSTQGKDDKIEVVSIVVPYIQNPKHVRDLDIETLGESKFDSPRKT